MTISNQIKRRVTPYLIVPLVAALLVGILTLSARSERRRLRETIDIGSGLVTALQTYHQDFGAFPSDLGALVPAYFTKVPNPTWGNRRWLFGSDGTSFSLSVGEGAHNYPSLYYDTHGWHYDD